MVRFARIGALLLAVIALSAGCGGDDDGGGGGSDGGAAGIKSCLDDAGLDVFSEKESTELDPKLVAAGATHSMQAIDVNQQDYSYEVFVFSAPDKASKYATEQQKSFDEQPQLKFQAEAFGPNVVTTTSDAPKRSDVQSCAKETG